MHAPGYISHQDTFTRVAGYLPTRSGDDPKVYYTWEHDKKEYSDPEHQCLNVDRKWESLSVKGFDRSALYIRFYF
jgi:hypothetical protein